MLAFYLAPKPPRRLLPTRRGPKPGSDAVALQTRLHRCWLLRSSQPALLLHRWRQAPRQSPQEQAGLERWAALLAQHLGLPLAAVVALVLGPQGIRATTHWLLHSTKRAVVLPSQKFCLDFESWLAQSTVN